MDSLPGSSDVAAAITLATELRILVGKLKRRLREQTDPGDFTWTQVSVLGHLEREGPATVTTLARAEGMRPQSMGANIAALEAAGLVTGTPDPRDGRQTILALTDRCREWIKDRRAAREDWLFRAVQTKLSPHEQADLARSVELLKRLVDS